MTDKKASPASVAAHVPMLSQSIRDHLGRGLEAVYAKLKATPPPDRMAELIARLDASIGQLQGQDERAFRAGLLEASASLHNFAVSLTRNPTTADDLVQDTMLRAWRSRGSFKPGTNLGAWLFTIMRNAFYSEHRRRAREVTDTDGEHARRLATVPEQGGHLDLQDARAALDQLPSAMREALILVAVENVSYEEAAVILNCRIGTVKSRVWRARDQLAHLLGYSATEVGADHLTLSVVAGGPLAVES